MIERQMVADVAFIKRITGHHVQRWGKPEQDLYAVRFETYRCKKNCLHGSRWIDGKSYAHALHRAVLYLKKEQKSCHH